MLRAAAKQPECPAVQVKREKPRLRVLFAVQPALVLSGMATFVAVVVAATRSTVSPKTRRAPPWYQR